MSLSRESAASLALYLAIAHPGIFDAFVSSLPGARQVGLGGLGDDGDVSDTSDESDFENSDGSLQEITPYSDELDNQYTDADFENTDTSSSAQDLRELGVPTYSDPVTGSAADVGNLSVVPGSGADPLSAPVQLSDVPLPDDLTTPTLDDITAPLQSISSSQAVQSIGAPAVGAVTSALTSPGALNAIANVTTAYLQNQALAGQENTALQEQANNIGAQLQMAAIDHPATGVTYVTGPNGEQEPVLTNASTGVPLLGANGEYIPASTGAGILSTLSTSTALKPLLILGGIGLLLLLLLGHHPTGGASGGSLSHTPPRRAPKFIEVE